MLRFAMRHRGVVTVALLAGLLVNLLVIGRLSPPDPTKGDMPLASHCQGGGPGCAEQPMIPPPAGGLPHFDAPPAPVFGALVLVTAAAFASVDESPPGALERPPITAAIA